MSQSGQKGKCGVSHCHIVSPVLKEAKHSFLPVVPIQMKEGQSSKGGKYHITSISKKVEESHTEQMLHFTDLQTNQALMKLTGYSFP